MEGSSRFASGVLEGMVLTVLVRQECTDPNRTHRCVSDLEGQTQISNIVLPLPVSDGLLNGSHQRPSEERTQSSPNPCIP